MAFGTSSKVFVATIEDVMEQTALFDFNTHSFKVALYGNSGTPSQTAASADTAYNVGAWITANELYDGAEWAQAGQVLDSPTFVAATNVITFDAADETSVGTSASMANIYGVLIYDDTLAAPVADQGVCYLYTGDTTVTNGTLTVKFNASGIFTITL